MLAGLMAAAGLYYLLRSDAARRLESVEGAAANRLRLRLRRVNGGVILLLAAGVATGCYAFNPEHPGLLYLADWLMVLLLMSAMLVLVAADLRLTYELRRHISKKWHE